MRSGVPIDNRGPDAGAFHATLEINDFPRKLPHILPLPFLKRSFTVLSYYRKSTLGGYKPHERCKDLGSVRHLYHHEGQFLCRREGTGGWGAPQAVHPGGG